MRGLVAKFFSAKSVAWLGSVALCWKSVVDEREGKSTGIVALMPSNFAEMLK